MSSDADEAPIGQFLTDSVQNLQNPIPELHPLCVSRIAGGIAGQYSLWSDKTHPMHAKGTFMKWFVAGIMLCLATPAVAQPALKAPISDIGFIVGQWKSDDGKVADTGETSKGESVISIEADGNALLRRDRTHTFAASGQETGSFGQIMMIYPERGALHADYDDGEGHVIHYVSAIVNPGKSVTFKSVENGGPVFRLTYDLQSPDTMVVTFGMVPPGQTTFRPIASGTLVRAQQ